MPIIPAPLLEIAVAFVPTEALVRIMRYPYRNIVVAIIGMGAVLFHPHRDRVGVILIWRPDLEAAFLGSHPTQLIQDAQELVGGVYLGKVVTHYLNGAMMRDLAPERRRATVLNNNRIVAGIEGARKQFRARTRR